MSAPLLVWFFMSNSSASSAVQTLSSASSGLDMRKMWWKENADIQNALKHYKESTAGDRQKKEEVEEPPKVKANEPVKATPNEKEVPSSSGIRVNFQDKMIYSFSVINVALTAYIFGHFPSRFYMWHVPKCVTMLSYRWYLWKTDGTGRHYLFYDFCYAANFLSLYLLLFSPHSPDLFVVLFTVANGPLAWSVLAFNNSLIFHSAQHMTSAFIHTSPMLLTFGMRWYSTPELTVCPPAGCMDVPKSRLFKDTMVYFYLPWLFSYYVWVFLVLRTRSSNKTTLFEHVKRIGGRKYLSMIGENDLLQKFVFMLCHLAFASFTMLLSSFFFHHKRSHFIFVFVICFSCAWNGSGYYIKVLEEREALRRDKDGGKKKA